MTLLMAQGLYKSFFKGKKKIHVLNGIHLQVAAGQMIAIVGASGVGKSTLLHLLGGLDAPTSGHVFFHGEDIFKYSEKKRAAFRNQHLGFVFQFHYLLPELSAIENVLMPALIAGYHRDQYMAHAEQLLAFVGLKHRLSHYPSELSGGEQQRVAIARAVVMQPKILLADELTGNLDSANRSMVIELLLELNRVTGVSILLVTHDMLLAGKMKTICAMQDGVFLNETVQNN